MPEQAHPGGAHANWSDGWRRRTGPPSGAEHATCRAVDSWVALGPCPYPRPAPLPAGPNRLLRVLGNLLSNAGKAGRPNGSGRIWGSASEIPTPPPPANATAEPPRPWPAQPPRRQPRRCVENNGQGSAQEFHELIFDTFFQVRHQTLPQPEGSGLGLASSREIVAGSGGRLWVKSEVVHGARF